VQGNHQKRMNSKCLSLGLPVIKLWNSGLEGEEQTLTNLGSGATGTRPSPATERAYASSVNWETATARPVYLTTWLISTPSKASWKRLWKPPERPSIFLRNSKPTQTS